MIPTRLAILLHSLRIFLLSIEISGKEATLPFISTPLAKANAEARIHELRLHLRQLQRTIV